VEWIERNPEKGFSRSSKQKKQNFVQGAQSPKWGKGGVEEGILAIGGEQEYSHREKKVNEKQSG